MRICEKVKVVSNISSRIAIRSRIRKQSQYCHYRVNEKNAIEDEP
jgi:hypothetical protein